VAGRQRFLFLGVTTGESAVHRVFDAWCEALGVDWTLEGRDLPLASEGPDYEQFLNDLRDDSCVGALVTSHKARLYESCWATFDLLEPAAFSLGEVGLVRKQPAGLVAGVSDIASGGHILRSLLDRADGGTPSEALIIGAGGAGLAAAWNLCVESVGGFAAVTIAERSSERAEVVRDVVNRWPGRIKPSVVHVPDSTSCSRLVNGLGAASLIVNASGVGKDLPGSPCSDDVAFPAQSIVWDFNYRGPLDFLRQAREQEAGSSLVVEDGLLYFAAGWSVVLTRVAGIPWRPDLVETFNGVYKASAA
jgi:shikimate 5-dehydrogenase